jgi:hypothetical protein
MNHMRTIGSRKISASNSDAYAPQRTAVVEGPSTLGRKMSNSGDRARRSRDGLIDTAKYGDIGLLEIFGAAPATDHDGRCDRKIYRTTPQNPKVVRRADLV